MRFHGRRKRAAARAVTLLALTLPAWLPEAGCARFDPRPLSADDGAAAWTARSLADPGLHRFLESALGESVDPWPPESWSVPQLTLAAVYFRPSLAVVRSQADLADAAIRTAGARPNPTLSLAPEWSANPDAGVSPWIAAVHLDWPIETAGKRGHRIARATAAAQAARLGVRREVSLLRRGVESAVIELAAGRARSALLSQESATTARLVQRLEERVEAGAASAADVAPFRLAALQSTAELAAAESAIAALEAGLAETLGVPRAAAGALVVAPLPPPDASPLLALTPDDALRRALLGRSDVLASLSDYAAAESALRLEIAKQYPDLHVGTGYQFDQGQNKWSVGVSLDLPILDQNQGPIAEAEAARNVSAARFTAVQGRAAAEVELALARRDGARDALSRLSAVQEDRRANLERIGEALALGATDRTAELEARLEVLRAERAATDAGVALQQALSELGLAIQEPAGEAERALGAMPPDGDHS